MDQEKKMDLSVEEQNLINQRRKEIKAREEKERKRREEKARRQFEIDKRRAKECWEVSNKAFEEFNNLDSGWECTDSSLTQKSEFGERDEKIEWPSRRWTNKKYPGVTISVGAHTVYSRGGWHLEFKGYKLFVSFDPNKASMECGKDYDRHVSESFWKLDHRAYVKAKTLTEKVKDIFEGFEFRVKNEKERRERSISRAETLTKVFGFVVVEMSGYQPDPFHRNRNREYKYLAMKIGGYEIKVSFHDAEDKREYSVGTFSGLSKEGAQGIVEILKKEYNS